MRTTIVSTSKLKIYKRIVYVIDGIALIAVALLVWSLYKEGSHWTGLAVPILLYLQFHMFYPMFLKLRNVNYDDSSIYFNKKGYEVQIPFEDVRSIEIKSVTGIYAINLQHPTQGEKQIFFKASAWYPFNFQKKDELVNDLRDRINQYKRTFSEKNFASLPSYKL